MPPIIERFVKKLYVTYNAVRLYPPASSIPRTNAAEAISLLRAALQQLPAVRLSVAKDGLFFEDAAIFAHTPVFAAFAREFYNRNLSEVRFHAGVTDAELVAFLVQLDAPPAQLLAGGGFEARLWDMQVDNITVKESSTRIVEKSMDSADGPVEVAGEKWPPTVARIEEILSGAFGGRPRDQRLLVRVIADPELLQKYLRDCVSGRGNVPGDAWVASRVSTLAQAVSSELPGDDQEALYRSIGEALNGLDPDMRRDVLAGRLLTEARRDEAVAEVLRKLKLEEVCEALVHGLQESETSREGLSRAIRNLAMVGLAGRDEVVHAARDALVGGGASEGFASAVLEGVSPSRLRVRERTRADEERPEERIVRLIDLAPVRQAGVEDEGILLLRQEAAQGLSDGDVMRALVAIVSLERRPEPFATAMALLEDTLGLLLERGDYDVAADAATALRAAAGDEALSEGQRRRVQRAIEILAEPAGVRAVISAMRLFPAGTEEHRACDRLLQALGESAVGSLLEALAAEQDMAGRKLIVDLAARFGSAYVDRMGKHVADGRWFVVRNVVSILAKIKKPEVLPHLQRTLRHGDARVRRETVRALAGIRDALSDEMLIAALEDEDEQNVQLAARYLGMLGTRKALSALQQVARGEGRGNREGAARVEALEALGRIGAPESLPVIDQIAKARTGFGGRGRELRAAAEGAAAEIRLRMAKGGQAR